MTARPTVTLAFTTYNVERYISGAFDAVLAQDFQDFEVVVADNQSSDSTWEICEHYARKDARFRIYRNSENIGVFMNVRRVIELADGRYFRLTAHDDLMAPTLLSRCVDVLESDPTTVLAYPSTIIIDDHGSEIDRWEKDLDLRDPRPWRRISEYVRSWALCNELFGLMRMDAVRSCQPFGTYVSSDKKFLVELLAKGKFHLIDEPLFYRRIHSSNTFGSNRRSGSSSDAAAVYAWLDPDAMRRRRLPAKFGRPTGDHNRLTVETFRALLADDQPAVDRLRNAATFLTVWQARRAHITLGRWRRRITNDPTNPPPWEIQAAAALAAADDATVVDR
jgi:glycosyltransferase involved in cell wall biosynthesis